MTMMMMHLGGTRGGNEWRSRSDKMAVGPHGRVSGEVTVPFCLPDCCVLKISLY